MKRTGEELFLDCIEFFEIIENDGYFVKYSDDRVFKKTHKRISYLWRPHSKYIYNLINQEPYKSQYPKAYQLIVKTYQEGYTKLSDYEKALILFNLIENGGSYLNDKFSDGTKIMTFLNNKMGYIYQIVCKYKKKYPKSFEIVFRLYYPKFMKKFEQYMKVTEQEQRKIPTKDKRAFDNGEKYSFFWIRNKEKICIAASFSEYKSKYPIACKIINRANKWSKTEYEEKCINCLKIINSKKSLLTSKDKIKLRCGILAVNFAKYNYYNMYKLVDQEDNKALYPIAYELLKEKIETINETKPKLTISERCIEYFKIVEQEGRMLRLVDKNVFSDGTYTKSLLMNNREQIYIHMQLDENKQQYPIAYQIIMNDYQKYKKRKENKQKKLILKGNN